MGVLKHPDDTPTALDGVSNPKLTNPQGFGPETTMNPDNVGPVSAGAPKPWSGGAGAFAPIRSDNSLPGGRDGSLPAGNAPVPGVTRK